MSDAANAFNSADHGFQMLDRTAIVPSLTNRKRFDPQLLSELSESIKAVGIAQPILVRPLPGSRVQETWTDRRAGDPAPTHEIVAGERRWRACAMAGVKTMPAMVRDLTDEQVLRLQLIENLQREDLHPLEEADGYRRILDLPDHASEPVAARIEELANAIKKSTRYIYQTLQLLKLGDFPRQVFLDGKLQRTVALEVSTIGNEAQQIEACRRVAGLGAKGSEVVEHPMSYRAAAEYIRNNFRLLLSKAPFPVKVEFAGVGACTGCEKMSANTRDLFDDSAKVPDTCLDPACYGKKNGKHSEQLAAAAKARGQRVITGKEARKVLPYENSPTSLGYNSEFEGLDSRRYEGKCRGRTLKQLLGDDVPAPVLIQRPDGQGFIEALPKKDVTQLLKDRKLLVPVPGSKGAGAGPSEAEKKARKVKAYRQALAEQLLQAVDKVEANAPAVELTGQAGLLSQLLLQIMVQLWRGLDHETWQRVQKLLGWTLDRFPGRDKTLQHFEGLSAAEINRFVVAVCIAPELAWGEYRHPESDSLDALSQLLHVDAKKLKADLESADKTAAKSKKTPAAKKTAAAIPAKSKPKAASKAVAAAVPPQQPGTFKVGDRVRFKQGLKGHAGMLRKVAGREGTVSMVRAIDGCVMVRTGTKGEGQGTRAHADELEFVTSTAGKEDEQLATGAIELSNGTKLEPQPAWPFPTEKPKVTEAPNPAVGHKPAWPFPTISKNGRKAATSEGVAK
jgi:ParB/RepB/Spo0J family partition protein